ncbi:MAG: glycine betaine ABC transporter substrate-binding protein [Halanaerobacter sp.]
MFEKSNVLIVSLVLISTLVLVGCGTSTTSSDKEESKGTIKIGTNNWADAIAVTNMWKVLLEEKGYQVEIVNGRKAPIWAGLNNGDLDLFLDGWLPNTDKKYWNQYKDNLTKLTLWYENTTLGLAVPEYVEEVDTITDLKEHKDKFMKNGEATIVGIDSGASVMEITNQALEEYQLDYNLIASSGPAMASSLSDAYKEKEPIVVTLWNPHWIFSDYDMKFLEEPKNLYGEVEDAYFIANNGFVEDYPEVAKWMKNCQLDSQTFGSLMAEIKDSDDAKAGAQKWVEDNRDVVEKWFE